MEQQDETNPDMDRLVRMVAASHTTKELALGFLRYETVRRLSPPRFKELCTLNLSGESFDDLVDAALKEWQSRPRNL